MPWVFSRSIGVGLGGVDGGRDSGRGSGDRSGGLDSLVGVAGVVSMVGISGLGGGDGGGGGCSGKGGRTRGLLLLEEGCDCLVAIAASRLSSSGGCWGSCGGCWVGAVAGCFEEVGGDGEEMWLFAEAASSLFVSVFPVLLEVLVGGCFDGGS